MEKKPTFRHTESASTAARCVDEFGLCAQEVPSRNGRTLFRVMEKEMD